jgi:hypothetical protein
MFVIVLSYGYCLIHNQLPKFASPSYSRKIFTADDAGFVTFIFGNVGRVTIETLTYVPLGLAYRICLSIYTVNIFGLDIGLFELDLFTWTPAQKRFSWAVQLIFFMESSSIDAKSSFAFSINMIKSSTILIKSSSD